MGHNLASGPSIPSDSTYHTGSKTVLKINETKKVILRHVIIVLAGTLLVGLASLVFFGLTSDASSQFDPLDSNIAYHNEAEEPAFQLQGLQSTAALVPTNAPAPFSTLDAILATAQMNSEQRATVDAAIKAEINAAVEGTLIALTPTATPLPTRVPVADTVVDHNPFLGPEDAPVTMVEFSDYQCSFCGRFHGEVLDPLLAHYGDLLRFVYREFPVIGGQSSAVIGAAAQCASFQGMYWEYVAPVWENMTGTRQPITDDDLLDYGTNIGLDMEAFESCLADGAGFDNVVIDFEAGRAYNITGTPTFFINGTRLVGAQPVEAFMNAIDRELLQLGIDPPERPEVSSSSN